MIRIRYMFTSTNMDDPEGYKREHEPGQEKKDQVDPEKVERKCHYFEVEVTQYPCIRKDDKCPGGIGQGSDESASRLGSVCKPDLLLNA